MRARIVAIAVLVASSTPAMAGAPNGDLPQIPGFFDLSVPGGAETLDALRIPAVDVPLTLDLLARTLHGQGNSAETAARTRATLAHAALLGAATAPDPAPADGPATVPVPWSDALWRTLLKVPRSADLFSAIVASRPALLVAAGATATDASIRALLADDRALCQWILRHAPGAFVVAARSLRIENRQVVVPGGQAAHAMWQELAGVSPAKPAEFLRALLTRDGGRLAWFFDTMASLDPARLDWALEAVAQRTRVDQGRELYAGFRAVDSSWHLEDHPFQRNGVDPQTIFQVLDLEQGRIGGPAWFWLWDELFSRGPIRAGEARPRPSSDRGLVSLSWLGRRIFDAPSFRERRARFEMVRLAQRVFSSATAETAPDLLVALSGYRRFPSLLLTLERIGVASPATWAASVEAAYRADEGSDADRRVSLAIFQGAVAIIERARLARSIDMPAVDRLLQTLADAVTSDAPVPQSVAVWIVESLVPALPRLDVPDAWTRATAYESTILQALAGRPGQNTVKVTWEGLDHVVDLAATERERIRHLREIVPSPGLDAALASRKAEELAAALIALVYTAALGDPSGAALLSPDVVSRHDFGESAISTDRRELGPWRVPRDMLGIDGPWRVEGSLLGLDIALSRLALRRLADQEMPRAPTINLNDWNVLGRTIAQLDPYALADADRDLLAAAIGRGRARVAHAAGSLPELALVAREARLSPTVQALLPWIVSRRPEAASELFSLRDLLWLGKPALSRAQVDRWGVPAEPVDGRLIPAMPQSAPWENHAGYADDGRMATQVPDLTLRLVEEMARLRLPARLLPALLAFAVQDFAHEVDARFADDWPALVRAARAVTSTRIEDYVAALAGTGHLR
ncbi:MAG: hypothetical protein ABR606_09635 [Vicinamibacterales bacterium]